MNDRLSSVAPSVSIEQFRALEKTGFRHGFIGRAPDVDVDADRAAALERLDGCHRAARRLLGLESLAFLTAEQVHGNAVAVIEENQPLPAGPVPGVDGLLTRRADVCLGIYVADCCAVYLVDPTQRAIGLIHTGKKGAELGIVPMAIETMIRCFNSRPEDMLAQLSPCIRAPYYEVDFPAQIIAQCRASGLGRIEDCGACTAADPVRYYSYRREKGRTGRMLALLASR